MDPISAFRGAAGLATSIIGGMKQTAAAKQEAAAKMQIANLEIDADKQRRQAMELDSSRKSMEVLRNSQRARAISLTASVSSGSQFGSGYAGAQGQISGQSGTNLLSIAQNTQIGENLFDISSQISGQRMKIAQASSDMATGAGISAIGKSISGAQGPLGNLATTGLDFFGGSSGGMKGIG